MRQIDIQRLSGAVLLLGGLFSALTLFGLIAEDVAEGDTIFFDLPVSGWLRSLSSPGLDMAMGCISWAGSAWAVVPAVLFAAWCYRHRPGAAGYLLIANACSALLNVATKHTFGRVRPTYWTPLVHETSYSFPSGHAMATMALIASLWLVRPPGGRRRVLLVLGALYVLAVGMSRMYLGVHYPSDVLAGWCVALVWCRGLAMSMQYRIGK